MKNAPPQKAPSASEQGTLKSPTTAACDLDEFVTAWTVYRDYVQTQVEREARSEERSATWRRHYKALSPFYQDYRRTTTRDHAFLPSPIAFAGNVRKTWLGPDDPSFDADLWSARLPEIVRKLDIYERELRVTAIRAILNATSSIPFADLSTDPADYPDAKYDDDFFQKPTSLFVGRAGGLFGPFYAVAYPDCLRMFRDQPYKCPESILLDSINERQVLFLRMILDAADIDESMATIRDLGTMGARFKWTNAPSVRKQARLYSWDDLVRLPSANITFEARVCRLISLPAPALLPQPSRAVAQTTQGGRPSRDRVRACRSGRRREARLGGRRFWRRRQSGLELERGRGRGRLRQRGASQQQASASSAAATGTQRTKRKTRMRRKTRRTTEDEEGGSLVQENACTG